MTSQVIETDRGPDQRLLKVTVFAPRSTTPKVFRWERRMLVRDAAAEAAEAFGYSGGTPSLSENDVVLDPDKNLAAAGVKSGDTLELVDRGGGV